MGILDDGSVAGWVREGLEAANVLYDVTLVRKVRVMNEDTGAVSSETTEEHVGRGLVVDYTTFERQQTSIEANDRRILIVQASLDTVPLDSDMVSAKGVTYGIVRKSGDPADAMWDIQVRE